MFIKLFKTITKMTINFTEKNIKSAY